jgi:hypothetical protein
MTVKYVRSALVFESGSLWKFIAMLTSSKLCAWSLQPVVVFKIFSTPFFVSVVDIFDPLDRNVDY